MPRGRPRASANRRLPQSLLVAAEVGLAAKSHLDLTTRDIAAIAGTHSNMIDYYFKGKAGLLTAVIDGIARDLDARLHRLAGEIAGEPNPTERIIRELVEAYYPHASAASVLFIEAWRADSPIKTAFETRHAASLFLRISRLIRILIKLGVYRADLDPLEATWSVLSLVAGPLLLKPLWLGSGSIVNPDQERWIANFTAILTPAFTASGAASAASPAVTDSSRNRPRAA
ncbi:MAG TPA: hypothetical protein VJQ47_17320 [Steroidobacteraceae bacterium]|nr:hypothetical protein [Steroidobacteraceae bacterium]